MTVTTTGGEVQRAGTGFRFISGEPLARLKDGLTVRVELEIRVLAGPGAAAAAAKASDVCSELRSLGGTIRGGGVGHRIAIGLAPDRGRGRGVVHPATGGAGERAGLAPQPAVLDSSRVADPQWQERRPRRRGLTLRGIIDTLSRRQAGEKTSHSAEAGPFRVRQ